MAKTALTRTGSPADVCRRLADLCLEPLGGAPAAPSPATQAMLRDFDALKKQLDGLLADENRAWVIELLQHLSEHRGAYRRMAVVWLDLVEELCLQAEVEFGDGTGRVKSEQVRAAAWELLYRGARRLNIRGIPDVIEPAVVAVIVQGTVDFLIQLVNFKDESLWRHALPAQRGTAGGPAPPAASLRWAGARDLWGNLLNRVLAFLLGVRLRPARLTPRMRTRVEAIASDWGVGTNAPDPELAQTAADLRWAFAWLGAHADQVREGVDAFAAAVQWSLTFSGLSQEQRQELVKEALLRYAAERGLGGPLVRFFVSLAVDLAFEPVVRVYRKRNLFV